MPGCRRGVLFLLASFSTWLFNLFCIFYFSCLVLFVWCVQSLHLVQAQVLPLLDAELVRAAAKPIIGYSDITGLTFALLRRFRELVWIGIGLLCLATIGRRPTDKHKATARKLFASSPPQEAAEDFLWTLLNSYDFLFVK